MIRDILGVIFNLYLLLGLVFCLVYSLLFVTDIIASIIINYDIYYLSDIEHNILTSYVSIFLIPFVIGFVAVLFIKIFDIYDRIYANKKD